MTYRECEANKQLLRELDRLWPNRSRVSDGWIGDAAHQSRESDHNPWIIDNGIGVVTARDITRDDEHGPDLELLAYTLIDDSRTKYVIFNSRIASQGGPWRPYTGSNPHDRHLHLSVNSFRSDYDDTSSWLTEHTDPSEDLVEYLAWSKESRDRLLNDITHYAIPHVAVSTTGSSKEPLLVALTRIGQIQRSLEELKAFLMPPTP